MGRLSEIIWYLNEDKHPTELERQHHYRYLTIDDGIRKVHRAHLAWKRKQKKKQKDD